MDHSIVTYNKTRIIIYNCNIIIDIVILIIVNQPYRLFVGTFLLLTTNSFLLNRVDYMEYTRLINLYQQSIFFKLI